jgi:hypothetical protein
VGGITINTIDQNGTREVVVTVRYRFHPLSANCTDTRAGINCTFDRVYRSPARRRAA